MEAEVIDGVFAAMAFCFLFGLVVGIALEMQRQHSYWIDECINRNVARYHPQTGKWEWTVEKQK